VQRFRELRPGVLAATASYAMTTSTVVVADGGCLVIDPAVSVADLAALAAGLDGAGRRPRAGR
jgi:hydroxyacylglutathione hydrolase